MHTRTMWMLIVLSCSISYAFGQTYHNEWIDYSKTYFKCKVGGFGVDAVNGSAILKRGLVRIPFATIAASGLSAAQSQDFQLWRDGKEVALFVSKASGILGDADFIEFVGEINNGKLDKELYRDQSLQLSDYWSLQTDTAAYFLTVNSGGANKRYQIKSFSLSGSLPAAEAYFIYTVGRYFRFELGNGFSAVAGQNIYSSLYDIGEGFTSRAVKPNACGSQGQLQQNFNFLYPFLGTLGTPAPNMAMRVSSVGNAANTRTVKVLLNNDSVTAYQIDYFYDSKIEKYLPVNRIGLGYANFVLINQSNASCDQFKISKIELEYPRKFNLGNNSNFYLNIYAIGTQKYLEITNFNTGGVSPVIYDVAHSKRYIGEIATAGKVKVLLDAEATDYQLFIGSASGANYQSINKLQTRSFVDYSKAANQGNYLIISNPLIYGSGSKNFVQQYSDYRSSTAGGGFTSVIVDADELADQFAWGIKKHPVSIKSFLKYAGSTFANAPKYVFLLGKGLSYNAYRSHETNALANQLNLVPTWGYPASDNLLASKDFTALPEIPIGRLSAVNPDEVGNYLQKVKQYDSVQNSNDRSIGGSAWKKNVLQIAGANDLSLGDQLDVYMDNYKTIISDTFFGANVTNFSKNADPAGYTDAIVSFKKMYEQGSSLITYFGHSSSTSLDFNLDNPETYNNQSKYPLFIANGCNAGNNFDFESNRLNAASTVSEKFIIAANRGAIGYLATTSLGIVNYLNIYTSQFYRALGKTKYGQSIGIAIKEGIRATLQATGAPDYFSRLHAEQYSLNGDPAVRLNSATLPDYAVEDATVIATPSIVSVADSFFSVKIKAYNIGKSTRDSVDLKIERISPSGIITNLFNQKIGPLYYADSVTVNVPVNGILFKGLNKIVATLDGQNVLQELSKVNNIANRGVFITEDEIRPVFPYNNGIVSNTLFKFSASTVNALSNYKQYIMEIDTTELFNSTVKKSQTIGSVGGLLEFEPGILLVNNTVYYWRVSPVMATPYWKKASFKYVQGAVAGFEQSQYYQHAAASYTNIYLDTASRSFKFKSKVNNLFIVNSIYPTSGLEDQHFSVSVNGNGIIASACDGPVFQFNVFNPISFKPWKNTTTNGVGSFGSGPADCSLSRQYNFEYRTTDTVSRRKAMQFMDMVPANYYVVVRTVSSASENINSYVGAWMADTTRLGSGNSIYHRLKSAGFATIDSFYKARTFSFVYKKGDASFTPRYAISQGVNDRINLNVNCTTPDTTGSVTSITYGPAKAWKMVKWAGTKSEPGNDVISLKVTGINSIGADTLIYSLNENQQQFDISAIDAGKYRFLKLSLLSGDNITATPYQLNYFKVEYDAAPEGGLAPNLYLNFPDTLQYNANSGQGVNDFTVGIGFKNASPVAFDSMGLKVILYNDNNVATIVPQPKTRPMAREDTLQLKIKIDGSTLSGWYNMYVEVNPDKQQPEQFSFNNFLFKRVFINGLQVLPVNLLNFTAVARQNNVLTNWLTNNESNTKAYEVEHSTPSTQYKVIGQVMAVNTARNAYQFTHLNAPIGKNYYRLKIISNNGLHKYSPVRLVTLGKGDNINLYPNPVKNVLNVSVSLPGGHATTLTLMNAQGQLLLKKIISGTSQINMAEFASGTYLIKVDSGVNSTIYKVQKY